MVYLYGQILATESFRLTGEWPQADSYGEIEETAVHPGGETGTAAVILASLGEQVKVAGTYIGKDNRDIIIPCFTKASIDVSELHDTSIDAAPDFFGCRDHVIIAGDTRTCLGEFQHLYARKSPWYAPAKEASVAECTVAAIDPYWGSEGAAFCVKHHTPYVTIDSPYDSDFARGCAVIAVSHEYLDSYYKGIPYGTLMERYTKETDGLVIFTFGAAPVMYGRKNAPVKTFTPFYVDVKSTLGAGDSFKAGCVYGLAHGLDDDNLVKTASAVAAAAITQYPIALNPPTRQLVDSILAGR